MQETETTWESSVEVTKVVESLLWVGQAEFGEGSSKQEAGGERRVGRAGRSLLPEEARDGDCAAGLLQGRSRCEVSGDAWCRWAWLCSSVVSRHACDDNQF